MTEFCQDALSLATHFSRLVEAGFTARQVSTGGALLLRETDRRINLLGRLAEWFLDGGNQERAEDTVG
jgi:hypothetical protein